MKFVLTQHEPHKDWGVNDPINLEHVVSFGGGTVRPRPNSTRAEAPAIIFTTDRVLPITWSFADEEFRDLELGRLVQLTIEPDGEDILDAIRLGGGEPAGRGATAEDEWKAALKYTTIHRDGVRIGVSCDSEAARRELQENFEALPRWRTMELPDGVQVLSVCIDAQRVGVMEKAAHDYRHWVPEGGAPDRVAKEPA